MKRIEPSYFSSSVTFSRDIFFKEYIRTSSHFTVVHIVFYFPEPRTGAVKLLKRMKPSTLPILKLSEVRVFLWVADMASLQSSSFLLIHFRRVSFSLFQMTESPNAVFFIFDIFSSYHWYWAPISSLLLETLQTMRSWSKGWGSTCLPSSEATRVAEKNLMP